MVRLGPIVAWFAPRGTAPAARGLAWIAACVLALQVLTGAFDRTPPPVSPEVPAWVAGDPHGAFFVMSEAEPATDTDYERSESARIPRYRAMTAAVAHAPRSVPETAPARPARVVFLGLPATPSGARAPPGAVVSAS